MLVQFNSEESRSNYRSLWNQFLNKVLNIGVLNTVSKTITGAINELLGKFNILTGLTSTVTEAGTTTLTVDSNNAQEFTGATTQTIKMPLVSTLILGRTFKIINNSTGILMVNSSGSNLITTIPAGETKIFTCIKITGTDETSWTVNDFGDGGISDETQAWSLTISFDKNYGSFNTNEHVQTSPQTYAINWTGAVFGALTHRTVISNGDTFTFQSGYNGIITDSATGSKALNIFTPIADRRYRITFECIDVTNQEYNVYISDYEKTAQLTAPVLSSATLDSGLDIDVVYTDPNSYPPETQIEIQTDTVNTFDSGSEFSNYAAKDSLTDKITCPNYSTLYYFRMRVIGDGINTQTSEWSNIESATTGSVPAIILMQDNFTGTTIDTGKWTEVDPTNKISQNDQLIFDITSSSITARTYYLQSIVDDSGWSTIAVQGPLSNISGLYPCWMLSLWQDNTAYNEIAILSNASGNAQLVIRENNVGVYSFASSVSINNTFKILKDGNNISFYYLSAPDAWAQIGSTQVVEFANTFKAALCPLCGTSNTGTVYLDDFYFTNFDYSTSTPV